MSDKISELPIYDIKNNQNFFSDGTVKYIIPLYQRAFAWEEKEIRQLIDDIYGLDDSRDDFYYLGSLIVERKDNSFEVVDGQQRLTALFLLLNYLKFPLKLSLTFECRQTSDITLKKILNGDISSFENLDEGLINGNKIIAEIFEEPDWETLGKKKINKDEFIKKLARVRIYRIEVPQYTNLNHYFEIMNTRGEQLEQQDILKARLLNVIEDKKIKARLAQIWDACSDMDGYLQMHFDVETRAQIFGCDWTGFPQNPLANIKDVCIVKPKTIKDIVEMSVAPYEDAVYPNEDSDAENKRFESIITFPYFLLHVLKVYIKKNNILFPFSKSTLNEQLDDKKLVDTFRFVVTEGVKNGQRINKAEFGKSFILCLLNLRFLFDKYIIKREFTGDERDGKWSLKTLKSSGRRGQKKAYYVDTDFRVRFERENHYQGRQNDVLMLQSCLRVSYTSAKVMHWITFLLNWLYDDNLEENISEFAKGIERFVALTVNREYLKAEAYNLGVNTPHIVFNYLDYLLWKNDKNRTDFRFEFRNSVEHWYPQHPPKNTFEKWLPDEGVDDFGNLCLMQRNLNLNLSNNSPLAKKIIFKNIIDKGSLKLRIMAENTKSDEEWRKKDAKEHGEAMLKLLKTAVANILVV